MIKNIIFDWDGTLADSIGLHEYSYTESLALVYPAALENFDYTLLYGLSTRDAMLKIGIPYSILDEVTHIKQNVYSTFVKLGKLKLFYGVANMLPRLRTKGYRLFIATGGSRASVIAGLKCCGIAEFFDGTVFRDDVKFGKPEPDIFEHCLEAFNLNACESIVVEDSIDGVNSARGAGLSIIGVHNVAIETSCNLWFESISDIERVL